MLLVRKAGFRAPVWLKGDLLYQVARRSADDDLVAEVISDMGAFVDRAWVTRR
jgi:hypothetical protein